MSARLRSALSAIVEMVTPAADDECAPCRHLARRVRTAANEALAPVDIWTVGPDGKYECYCGERIHGGSAHGCARLQVDGVEGDHEVRCGALFGAVCTCREGVPGPRERLQDARIDALERLGRTDGTLGYQHEMKQERRLAELEANVEALVEWGDEALPHAIQEWASSLTEVIREAVEADEKDLVRLADALNQFGMEVEDVAQREFVSAMARLDPKRERRMRNLHTAARKMRERVAPIIDRLDP